MNLQKRHTSKVYSPMDRCFMLPLTMSKMGASEENGAQRTHFAAHMPTYPKHQAMLHVAMMNNCWRTSVFPRFKNVIIRGKPKVSTGAVRKSMKLVHAPMITKKTGRLYVDLNKALLSIMMMLLIIMMKYTMF